MTENRYRTSSPSRRYGDPRASTGMVISSSFDPRYPQQPRNSVAQYPSTRHASIYDTQPIKRRTYADGQNPGATISRTEYAVRPRHNSLVTGESRRPMSTLVRNTSPPRNRPVVSNSSRDDRRSPVRGSYTARDDANRYLIPASSQGRHNHYRHNSATRADIDRLSIGGGSVSRPRGEYNHAGGYGQKAYATNRAPLQDEDFSYTGPREQFARDMSSRAPERAAGQARRERPMSVIDTGGYRPPDASRRDMGPPHSARPIERSEAPDSSRLHVKHGYDSDPDKSNDVPRRRHSTRAPVVHQHRNEGNLPVKDEYEVRGPTKFPVKDEYEVRGPTRPRRDRLEEDDRTSKQRPRESEKLDDRARNYLRDYDPDRDRERDRDRVRGHERPERVSDDRREVRSRDSSPERAGIGKNLATAGLGGIAAAGLAGAVGKTSRNADDASDHDTHRERRHRKHRHRDRPEEEGEPAPLDARPERGPPIPIEDRDPIERRNVPRHEDSASESVDDGRGKRKHHRRKHRDKPDTEREMAISESVAAANIRPEHPPEDLDADEAYYRKGDRAYSRGQNVEPEIPEERTLSPGDGEDDRPRRVQLVEPVKDKEEAARPRGILKPARQVPFPEDPNPTREGVAPLKDAGKQGVPQGARWTKISRVLVNPEALEKAHERFEERDDYVIVLRVITKEEIQKLAEKTREIRDAREREWQDELDKRRRRRPEKHRSRDGESASDDGYPDENQQQPEVLAIDQHAAVPGIDPRTLTGQDEPIKMAAGGMPIPDIKLDTTNYSTNV